MRLSTTLETTVTVSDAGQDNLLYDQPRAVSDENGWSGLAVLCSTEHFSAITEDADGTDANVAFYVDPSSGLRHSCRHARSGRRDRWLKRLLLLLRGLKSCLKS